MHLDRSGYASEAGEESRLAPSNVGHGAFARMTNPSP
jgi:hypothetical protein